MELHEIRGFVSDDLMGAMREAYAVSKGTKCHQHLFSVSLSPPQTENVGVEVFEQAIEEIEERNSLSGQPRIIVFHEKEGRRHCHAAWSRIDAEQMRAVNLSFFKNKLRDVSRQLYLDHGWRMPKGLMDSKARDPFNYDLATYQQAKRIGVNARDLKRDIQECYAVSDSASSFQTALKECGFRLAKGDRRGFVAVPVEHPNEVFSVARATRKKAKVISAKLGDPKALPSVDETRTNIAGAMTPQYQRLIQETREVTAKCMRPLEQKRQAMKGNHGVERQTFDTAQQQRWIRESQIRSVRMNSGLKGLWQALSGERQAIKKQNELETFQALERDREQRQHLIQAQLQDRQRLQEKIQNVRQAHVKTMRQLHLDMATNKKAIAPATTQPQKPLREAFKPAVETLPKATANTESSKSSTPLRQPKTPTDRLKDLRSSKSNPQPKRDKGPDLER